jgi:hypothetical protein
VLHAGFLREIVFSSEDRNTMLLRNTGTLSSDHTALSHFARYVKSTSSSVSSQTGVICLKGSSFQLHLTYSCVNGFMDRRKVGLKGENRKYGLVVKFSE